MVPVARPSCSQRFLPLFGDGAANFDAIVAGPAATAFSAADFFGFLISRLDLC
jgi:hypothetical protein